MKEILLCLILSAFACVGTAQTLARGTTLSWPNAILERESMCAERPNNWSEQSNARISLSIRERRLDRALLAGGIIAGTLGSVSLFAGTYDKIPVNASGRRSLLSAGLSLNLAVMPFLFIFRDAVQRKAAKIAAHSPSPSPNP